MSKNEIIGYANKINHHKSIYKISNNKLRSDFAKEEIRNSFSSCYQNGVIKRGYIKRRREGIQETKGKHEWDPS